MGVVALNPGRECSSYRMGLIFRLYKELSLITEIKVKVLFGFPLVIEPYIMSAVRGKGSITSKQFGSLVMTAISALNCLIAKNCLTAQYFTKD